MNRSVPIYRQEHLDKSLLLGKLVSLISCLIKIPSVHRQSQNATRKEFFIFRDYQKRKETTRRKNAEKQSQTLRGQTINNNKASE
jgi:hypothetical protein